MSEEGWRKFLKAEGVDDWVVLHGGATAVFSVVSLTDQAGHRVCIASWPDGATRQPEAGS
jgi:4a-hydroxytetrahydrobiopterin dehydratase